MPNSCVCCGHVKGKGVKVAMFRLPMDKTRRQQWMNALNLTEEKVNEHTRVCSRHFLHGDSLNTPSLDFGKRFASPKKLNTERSRRVMKRARCSVSTSSLTGTPASSCASSVSAPIPSLESGSTMEDEPMSVAVGKPLLSDYGVHELPLQTSYKESDTGAALSARVEYLEAEIKHLRNFTDTQKMPMLFRIEEIADNDSLIKFYTGFASYILFLNFFEFLGPAVYRLKYWGDSERKTTRRRKNTVLTPLNQYFLTLVKLRLNLQVKDLAHRFCISTGLVSKYFITWISFMYHHLKEIDWTPSVEQVAATLPCAFQEKYPTKFSIIDGSEIFIETPSDLFMQSSTWSNYKHHNTAKFLIGCTPNGAISFVSQLYVGSISDKELTRVSGYLQTLDGKSGLSVMADRGLLCGICWQRRELS